MHSFNFLALSLSRLLQSKSLNLTETVHLVDGLKKELEMKRQTADECFHRIFKVVKTVYDGFDTEIKQSRVTQRQTHRVNVQAWSAEDYYRITTYIPYVDVFITALDETFFGHLKILANFSYVFPDRPSIEAEIIDLCESYLKVLHDRRGKFTETVSG